MKIVTFNFARSFSAFLIVAMFSACGQDKLETYEVTQFIATMGESGRIARSVAPLNTEEQKAMIMEGKFAPYQIAYEKIKAGGKVEELEQLAKSQGFSSSEAWAEIGDRIMLAYLAIKLEGKLDDLGKLKVMPASMKSQLPPDTLKILEGMQKLAETLRSVPKDDIETVRGHVAAIEVEANSSGYTIPE